MLYLLLQSSSPLQWQNNVQLSPFALQLHLSVAHGVSLLKPHFKSLSSSAGAMGLSEGTIVGERAALPSGWYHPCSVGSRAGGSVLRQSRQMATADELSECCLSWRSIWNMLITCSQNLHASPLVEYALSFEVLIRQIMLEQRWREWFLSTTVWDYLIFSIQANGIGHLSFAETGYRIWD